MGTYLAFNTKRSKATKRKELGFVYWRCSAKYDSSTKLHEHVRTKHRKKPTEDSKKNANEEKSSPPSATIELATPPATPPPVTSIESPSLSAPTSPATTPGKSMSWAEVASRPKPSTPSHSPRRTLKYGVFTPPVTAPPSPYLLPILQPSKLANHMTKRPSITRFAKTQYLTIEDLYARFHEKPKPTSLVPIRNGSHSAPSSGMRPRQMRIKSYFKPTSDSPGSKTKLA